MSWHNKYLEEASAWRVLAQKFAAHGKETRAAECKQIAIVYQNLADKAIDKPSQDDKM